MLMADAEKTPKNEFWKNTALPYMVGLATYIGLSMSPIIPRTWSLLPFDSRQGVLQSFLRSFEQCNDNKFHDH